MRGSEATCLDGRKAVGLGKCGGNDGTRWQLRGPVVVAVVGSVSRLGRAAYGLAGAPRHPSGVGSDGDRMRKKMRWREEKIRWREKREI